MVIRLKSLEKSMSEPEVIQNNEDLKFLIKGEGEIFDIDPENRIISGIISAYVRDNGKDRIKQELFGEIKKILLKRQTPLCDSHTSRVHGRLIGLGDPVVYKGFKATPARFQVYDDFESDDIFWNKILTKELNQFSIKGSGWYHTMIEDGLRWDEIVKGLEVLEISAVKNGAVPIADIFTSSEEIMELQQKNLLKEEQTDLLKKLLEKVENFEGGFQKVNDRLDGFETEIKGLKESNQNDMRNNQVNIDQAASPNTLDEKSLEKHFTSLKDDLSKSMSAEMKELTKNFVVPATTPESGPGVLSEDGEKIVTPIMQIKELAKIEHRPITNEDIYKSVMLGELPSDTPSVIAATNKPPTK